MVMRNTLNTFDMAFWCIRPDSINKKQYNE